MPITSQTGFIGPDDPVVKAPKASRPFVGPDSASESQGFVGPDESSSIEAPSVENLPGIAPVTKPSSVLRRAVADPLLDLASGLIAAPKGIIGLGSMVTGGRIGRGVDTAMDKAGLSTLSESSDFWQDLKSPEAKEAQRRVSEAKGFTGKVAEAVRNPSTIGSAVIQSVPPMLAGGGIARAVGLIPKLAPIAMGLGEGAIGAGSAAESIRESNPDKLLTLKQSALSAAAGAGTAALGVLGGKLAAKLKIVDPDTWAAGMATPQTALPLWKRVIGGAVSEGLFEELPQSVQEQMLQNEAMGRPIMEGVAENAAMGLLAGTAMGGGANIPGRAQVNPPATPQMPSAAAPIPTPAPAPVAPVQAQATPPAGVQADLDQGEQEAAQLRYPDVTAQVQDPRFKIYTDAGYTRDQAIEMVKADQAEEVGQPITSTDGSQRVTLGGQPDPVQVAQTVLASAGVQNVTPEAQAVVAEQIKAHIETGAPIDHQAIADATGQPHDAGALADAIFEQSPPLVAAPPASSPDPAVIQGSKGAAQGAEPILARTQDNAVQPQPLPAPDAALPISPPESAASPKPGRAPILGRVAETEAGETLKGFDSKAFNDAREATIKESKAAGNTHLDQVEAAVETMRGKSIYYAHDPKVRGVIRTVDNRGSVYVDWSDQYSADKEMASPTVEKQGRTTKTVFRTSLGPTDLKDYVFAAPSKSAQVKAKVKAGNESFVEDAAWKRAVKGGYAGTLDDFLNTWKTAAFDSPERAELDQYLAAGKEGRKYKPTPAVKPPELMTPEEFAPTVNKYTAGSRGATFTRITYGVKGTHIDIPVNEKTSEESAIRQVHEHIIKELLRKKSPVSAVSIDAYGMTPPPGYTREGDRYVYRSPAPVESKPAKASWEMTRAEYARGAKVRREMERNYVMVTGSDGKEVIIRTLEPGQPEDGLIEGAHRVEIAEALREGKPVPAAILADYPDLAPKPLTGAEKVREKVKGKGFRFKGANDALNGQSEGLTDDQVKRVMGVSPKSTPRTPESTVESLPDQLNAGTAVKPRDATFVRVNGKQVVPAADVDTLKGAGPFKSAEWGTKGKAGFVPMGGKLADLKRKIKGVNQTASTPVESRTTPVEPTAETGFQFTPSDSLKLRRYERQMKAAKDRGDGEAYDEAKDRYDSIFNKSKQAPAAEEPPVKVVKPPAPVKVETAPSGDVTVSVPKADKPGLPAKEQKKYLLAEIDKAIEGAIDAPVRNADAAAKDFGTVTIEVPNDGTFTVINSKQALEEFKKSVKARFPAKVPEQSEPKAAPKMERGDRETKGMRDAVSLYGSERAAARVLTRQLDSDAIKDDADMMQQAASIVSRLEQGHRVKENTIVSSGKKASKRTFRFTGDDANLFSKVLGREPEPVRRSGIGTVTPERLNVSQEEVVKLAKDGYFIVLEREQGGIDVNANRELFGADVIPSLKEKESTGEIDRKPEESTGTLNATAPKPLTPEVKEKPAPTKLDQVRGKVKGKPVETVVPVLAKTDEIKAKAEKTKEGKHEDYDSTALNRIPSGERTALLDSNKPRLQRKLQSVTRGQGVREGGVREGIDTGGTIDERRLHTEAFDTANQVAQRYGYDVVPSETGTRSFTDGDEKVVVIDTAGQNEAQMSVDIPHELVHVLQESGHKDASELASLVDHSGDTVKELLGKYQREAPDVLRQIVQNAREKTRGNQDEMLKEVQRVIGEELVAIHISEGLFSGAFNNPERASKLSSRIRSEIGREGKSASYRTAAEPSRLSDANARSIVRRILGPSADVTIVDRIFENGASRLGKYQAGMTTIARRGDMDRTAFHEAYHGAEDMLMTDAERSRVEELEPDAEKRADAFMEYAADHNSVTGKLRGLFDRLMYRIKALFGKAGKLDELKALHARIMGGEMAGRVATVNQGVLETANATITAPGAGQPAYMVEAYHGTPHTYEPEPGAPFGKVKKEKVGTGEGAAAYGWGVLYAAQEKSVAENYRDRLQKPWWDRVLIDGKPMPPSLVNVRPEIDAILGDLADNGKESAVRVAQGIIKDAPPGNSKLRESVDRMIRDIQNGVISQSADAGNVYHVELEFDPEDCLDWDKPLSAQGDKVRQSLFMDYGAQQGFNKDPKGSQIYEDLTQQRTPSEIGSQVYFERQQQKGKKLASEYLASLGIKGIRYADQGSRQNNFKVEKGLGGRWWVTDRLRNEITDFDTEAEARAFVKQSNGGPTYNYVVFNESDIRVVGRNGETLKPTEAMKPQYRTDPAGLSDNERLMADSMQAGQRIESEAAKAATKTKLDALKARMQGKATEQAGKAFDAGQVDALDSARDELRIAMREARKREPAMTEPREGVESDSKRVVARWEKVQQAIVKLREASEKAGQKDMKLAIRTVYDAIRDSLSGPARVRAMPALKLVKDAANLDAAMFYVREVAEEQDRRDLIAHILNKYGKIIGSPSVRVEFKALAKQYLSGIQLREPKAKQLERLQALRDYIATAQSQGINVDIPRYLLEQVARLADRPLSGMSTAELMQTAATLDIIEDAGRRQFKTDDERRKQMIKQTLDRMEEKTVPMKTESRGPIMPDDVDTIASKFSERWENAKTVMMKWKLWHAPVNVVMDMLDGSPGYDGWNYRTFIAGFNSAWNGYLGEKHRLFDEMSDVAKVNQIKRKQAIRIGIYAVARQQMPKDAAYGRNKLYNTFNAADDIAKAKVDQMIDEITLTPEEQRFYDWMNSKLDGMWDRINDYTKRVWNFEINKNDFYFPMITDWAIDENAAMFGTEVVEVDPSTGMLVSPDHTGQATTKTVKQDFSKSRKGAGSQKVQMDALKVMQKHFDDALYAVHMGEQIKFAQEVASSDRYREIAGDVGQKYVQKYLTKMARKGGTGSHHTIRALDILRKNMGIGALGFNPMTVLVQFSSLIDGFGKIGPGFGVKGVSEVFTKEGRDFIKANMPEVVDRMGGDWSFTEVGKLGKMAYKGIAITDEITAGAVALGAYAKSLHDRGMEVDYSKPDQKAIDDAQHVVNRTQATGSFRYQPMAVGEYGSISKAVYQFQTFPMNKFWYMMHDGITQSLKSGDWKQAAQVLFWAQAALLAEQGIRLGYAAMTGSGGGGDDDKEAAQKMASNILWDNLQSIPLFGAISRSARYGSTPIPILSAPTDFGKGMKSATTGAAPETRMRGAIRATAAAGQVVGAPGVSAVSRLTRGWIHSDSEDIHNAITESAKRLPDRASEGRIKLESLRVYNQMKREGKLKPGTTPTQFRARYKAAFKRLNP